MTNLKRIAPELPVTDLDAAIDYYEQKLGFRVVMQMPSRDYAIVERDDVAIHLFVDASEKGGPGKHSPVGIHIFTADLETLYIEFKDRGAHLSREIVRKPWGNRDFHVHDEFGNELKFTDR